MASRGGIRLEPLMSPRETWTAPQIPLSWVRLHSGFYLALMVPGVLILRSFGICRPRIRVLGNVELTPSRRNWERRDQRVAPQYELRLLYGRGGTECPSDYTHYGVWELPERRISGPLIFFRGMGIDLGPLANDAVTNFLAVAKSAPPDMRKASDHELLGPPQFRGQHGYPPTTHAAACLGYARTGCQIAEIAATKCDADKYILACFDGGRNAAKAGFAQKAE